jgi:hypothetical protein
MNRLSRADILTMFGYKAGTKLYNLLYSSCANFCCIIKNCLGISSGGNAGLVLNQQGNWVTLEENEFIEVANFAALPVTGESGVIYVTLDTNKLYRWTGSTYVEISASVSPVWGGITGTLSNQTDLQNALNADTFALDFTAGVLTYSFYAPYAMKINSVTNVLNSPTTTITTTVGLTPYTLGNTITIGTLINITVSTSSVIRLNILTV